MARNGRWTSQDEFDVPLTPLIDIIFILIVFFLVATTFYSEERDMHVNLPEGTEGEAIAKDNTLFVINVRESGIIVVNDTILSMEDLATKLENVARTPERNVEIRGDTKARHGTIMSIMNLCRKLGITDYAVSQRIVHETE